MKIAAVDRFHFPDQTGEDWYLREVQLIDEETNEVFR